ncbi:MAG: Mrp/NBP35 family ATP-binding protein [Rikenellaceae bacterium]
MTQENIQGILKGIIHPETGMDIITSGVVESLVVNPDSVSIILAFEKGRNPFASSIKRQIVDLLTIYNSKLKDNIIISIKETIPKPVSINQEKQTLTSKIKKIIAVGSGKGGVGKSTVTSNLAVSLSMAGYKVGVLDGDIYGPSQPKMFGVEGYRPDSGIDENGIEYMVPAESMGIKIMSIGFFISMDDALVWRGPMATNALRQLIHQTQWGELDFLLIDLPPGTGDVHLTILQELTINSAIIISTPQAVATADVLRGINMFRAPKVNIPILGIIQNMAWFTPMELPDNKYYIFGKNGASDLAKELEINLLGEIPIIESVAQSSDEGTPEVVNNSYLKNIYLAVNERIISKM